MAASRYLQKFQKVRPKLMMSLPVASFGLITSVAAASETNLVNPKDLDIYAEPHENKIEKKEEELSRLQLHVSKVRKFVWEVSDKIMDYYSRTANKIMATKRDFEDFYDAARDDPVLLLKPSAISSAMIIGLALPPRGRRKIERILLSSVFGLASAAICFPKQTIKISKECYESIASFSTSLSNTPQLEKESVVENVASSSTGDTLDSQSTVKVNDIKEDGVELAPDLKESPVIYDSGNSDDDEKGTQPKSDPIIPEALVVPTTPTTDSNTFQLADAGENVAKDVIISASNEGSANEVTLERPQGDIGQSDPEDHDMYSKR